MSRKLKRGGTSVRKVAAQQGTARKVRTAKAKTGSLLDRIVSSLPFSEAQLHRVFLAAILGGAVVLAWVVASFAGVPAMAQEQVASLAADAGFKVRRVELRGVNHLNQLKVYERVLSERDRAMPLVDIGRLRDELLELSWVDDARVSRQLPDTLVIDIVERVPHAVLRKADRLVLIDAEGHELEPISPERARGKLVLAGPGAGQQVTALSALLDAAPALGPQVHQAEWVGNRRWNLTFQTGQILALPEGEKPAANALVSFARLDGTNRLLGGRVVAFDMRAPDRIYLRVPNRAADAAAAAQASAAALARAKAAAAGTARHELAVPHPTKSPSASQKEAQ
ncbi:MAG: FtsQ-type POTRA domain-containing protein [Novosphingobium sp.]|nr:FtsQ-type POTRA domain-containing protein [Novosphingobium sp.]